jgi:hypothetical protein
MSLVAAPSSDSKPLLSESFDNRAKLAAGSVEPVGAQLRIDGVVVKGVTEIVGDQPALDLLDSVEDVCRVPGDKICTGTEQVGGDSALPAGWAASHVRSPVGEGNHEVARLPEAANLFNQPVWRSLPEVRTRDTVARGTGSELRWVVRYRCQAETHGRPADHDPPACVLEILAGARRGDALLFQMANRVGEGIWAEVERVVVGKPYGVNADRVERSDRRLRRPEEEPLTSNELGWLSPIRDAAFEVADQKVEGGGDLDQLRGPNLLGRHGGEPVGHASAEHHVAKQANPPCHGQRHNALSHGSRRVETRADGQSALGS